MRSRPAFVKKNKNRIFNLPGAVIQELWIVVFLAPTISTDLKAQVHPQLFLFDALKDFRAEILTRLPEEIVSELIRHKLTEAAWSKLLSPF